MLECLESYDPYKGAEFLTYAHHAIGNALIQWRMMEESGSFASLDEYKRVRGIAWLYSESGKSLGNAVREYATREGYSEETAEQYLTAARFNRSRVPLYVTVQDEDAEESGEDVTRDDSRDYSAILWNGAQAAAVQAAFEKLTYREQRLLEERNAICMTCGRTSPISERKSFEELAVMFEGSTASVAERAYRRAVEKLTVLLVEAGALHAVRLRRKSVKRAKKKIAAAVYEYQADCDGEWGEIQFDFENSTAEIVRLAEWDTMISNTFARRAIGHINNSGKGPHIEFAEATPFCSLPEHLRSIANCCSYGYDRFYVDVTGEVLVCGLSRIKLGGNVLNNTLSEIKRSSDVYRMFFENQHVPDTCTACDIFSLCHGGCRAAALSTGSWEKAKDPNMTR